MDFRSRLPSSGFRHDCPQYGALAILSHARLPEDLCFVERLNGQCANFLVNVCYDCGWLRVATESGEYDLKRAERDFWVSRNGHGVGFWSRGPGEAGDPLHAVAKKLASARFMSAMTENFIWDMAT